MKILATALIFVFFSLFFCLQTFSQSQSNNSLLWRISGNGLSKPSYLFGTMHVYDKKAFDFKDSLYIFLQRTEGFALEINPDSATQIIEAYMNGSLKTTNRVSAKKSEIMPAIDTATIKPKQKKIIEKKLNRSEEDKKNMVDEFVSRLVASDKKQENSMNTFMDAYLYEMAKQWGKKMYGLEEISGQIAAFQALQKGVKFKKAENLILSSDSDESPIEKFYYKEDLDSIDIFYKDYFTDEGLDGFLYNRNKVMAAKIDSLVHLQTMFTAIGAAHLPGSKGVIALLKQKGYTVEPVFSSQKIFASDYKLKLSAKTGYVVREEQMGLEYEIPGKPNSQNGEAGKLVSYYYDLGSGLLYMTICGKVTTKESEQTPEEFATQLINQFAAKSQAKIISSKTISSQGLKGLESLCMIADKGYMRLYELVSKNMFYLFSLSGEIKDNLYSENAEKYLASFKLIPIPASQWMPYEFPDDGFKIYFPGKPTIKPLNKKDEANTSTNSYTYFDANTGINYTITSSKTQPYNNFISDELFFKNYSDYFASNSSKGESSVSDTVVNGFPGRKLLKPSIKNSWKGFVIKRGTTSYFVVAEYEPGIADKVVDQFLRSFSLIDFAKPEWQVKTSPAKDFSLWAPSEIFEKRYNTAEIDLHPHKKNYYAYDRYSGLTYFVNAEPVSDYYWAPNEDSIYNEWEKSKVNWNDSLIKQNVIKNGQRTGRELTYTDKAENTTIRKRLLLNGQTMYSFYVTIPPAFADESNIDQFFEKIKFTEEKTPDEILNNSPAKLFKDLQSGDSATFQKAYDALDKVKFGQDEFMLLLQRSLLQYPKYKNTYPSVNKKLLMLANKLYNDAGPYVKKQAIDFIKDNYSHTDKTIEEIRFDLLEIIASDKSQEDFELIKKMLAEKLPSKGYDYTLFRHFRDTLGLAKIFYPDVLQYISDTTMGMGIISLTKEMIDSNMLSINILSYKKADVLKLARRQLKLVLKTKKNDEEFYDYRVTDLLELMGMMKQKEMNDLVNEFLKAKLVDIKEDAAITLIKNNKPVSPLVLKQVAKDKYERAELYDDLSKINKAGLFPVDFRSQQKMAESYIYQSMHDNDDDDIDYTDAGFIYIKNIEYRYKGEKKRFYLFRINFPQSDEDSTGDTETQESNSYLAIAGPFELDATKINLEVKKNITGIYYDKKFDGSLLDDHFKDFIEQRLKWDK